MSTDVVLRSEDSVVAHVPFIPGLTWRERILRCGFDPKGDVDPRIWEQIEEFAPVPEEDPDPIPVVLFSVSGWARRWEVMKHRAEKGSTIVSFARFLHMLEDASLSLHSDLVPKIVCLDFLYQRDVLDVPQGPLPVVRFGARGQKMLTAIWSGSPVFPGGTPFAFTKGS